MQPDKPPLEESPCSHLSPSVIVCIAYHESRKDEKEVHRQVAVVYKLVCRTCRVPGTGLYGMRLDRIRTYVSCNYSRRITISDMAKYAGMNRSAFCRFFRKHTGKTFISYLNEFRIQKAAFLLENEGCSVSEACYASGFNDISYLCRKFRSITGRTPSSLLD